MKFHLSIWRSIRDIRDLSEPDTLDKNTPFEVMIALEVRLSSSVILH